MKTSAVAVAAVVAALASVSSLTAGQAWARLATRYGSQLPRSCPRGGWHAVDGYHERAGLSQAALRPQEAAKVRETTRDGAQCLGPLKLLTRAGLNPSAQVRQTAARRGRPALSRRQHGFESRWGHGGGRPYAVR